MKSYEELRKEFIEEVGKIDISKLSLGGFGNTYKDYAELLQAVYMIPEAPRGFGFDPSVCLSNLRSTPKVESEGE